MTAKDFVHKWLNQHRGFTFEEVTPAEQAHFELILSYVCEAYLENERKEIINKQIYECTETMCSMVKDSSDEIVDITLKMCDRIEKSIIK